MPRPLSTPGKDPVPIVQGAGWVPGPVWTDAENLASNGIQSPDCPARSQSLYRLSYRASLLGIVSNILNEFVIKDGQCAVLFLFFLFYKGRAFWGETVQ
jgi:hypothetical protein